MCELGFYPPVAPYLPLWGVGVGSYGESIGDVEEQHLLCIVFCMISAVLGWGGLYEWLEVMV